MLSGMGFLTPTQGLIRQLCASGEVLMIVGDCSRMYYFNTYLNTYHDGIIIYWTDPVLKGLVPLLTELQKSH